jgi:ABC-type multidrug transport system fused ATPase/permease subunit
LLNNLSFIFDKQDKKKFFILFLLILLLTILDVLSIASLIPFLSVLSNDELFSNKFVILIFETFNFIDKSNFKKITILLIIFTYSVKFFLTLIIIFKKNRILYDFYTKISNKLMGIYLNTSYSNSIKTKLYQKINTLSGEVENFVSTLIDAIVIIILELLTITLIVIFLLYMYPRETLFICIFLIFFCPLLVYFYQKKMKFLANDRLGHFNNLQKKILEGLNGFRDIKINNKETFFLSSFNKSVNSVSESLYKISNIMQTPRYLIETISICVLLIVMLINLDTFENNSNNIIFLGIFAGAALRLLPSINKLVVYTNNIKYAVPILNQILDDIKNNLPEQIQKNERNIFLDNKKIKFNNVYFDYNENKNKDDFILQDINFEINNQEFIGIFGDTGSGKSTLIDILSGLLKPSLGTVFSDSKNINDAVHSWRNNVGYVSQFPYLLNDTIEKNIAFGYNQENINENALKIAMKNAVIYDFVINLPLKEKTIVGENGKSLSGGQIQRIGIARALYKDPSILIFDESTNSLDMNTEKEFMDVLRKLKNDRTIIFVTHKLELLNHCDKVFQTVNNSLKKVDIKNLS